MRKKTCLAQTVGPGYEYLTRTGPILHICGLPKGHKGPHRDFLHKYEWEEVKA